MSEATSPATPLRTVCGSECQTDLLDDTMQACGFSDKYIQSKDVGSRVLGHGGSSASIERCFSALTGEEFAVKRLRSYHEEKFPYLAQNEMRGLLTANRYNIPRVVKFIESFRPPSGGVYLIVECVDGRSLGDCLDLLPVGDSAVNTKRREKYVIDMAAQMLQTVYWLHMGSRVVHLDITGSNIMLRSPEDGKRNWDELRLLDFGFAQSCSKDVKAMDIEPQGATAPYAAPELLQSLQLQYEGATSRRPGVLINGCAADWWAIGVVLYELLTGELPFITHAGPASTSSSVSGDGSAALDHVEASLDGSVASSGPSSMGDLALIEVPESVLPRDRVQWAKYQAMLQAQQSWVDACELAHSRSPVQHPILDRVRQCSANPDQATSFFLQVFSLVPHQRALAKDTPWCCDTIHKMEKDMGLQPEKRSCCWGVCAALCGCWAGSSPLLHDQAAAVADSPQANAESKQSKAWQKYLPCKMGLNRKAKGQAAACSGSTDHIEVVASQAGSSQTAAGASAHGKHWRRIKRMFIRRSQSTSQHAGQATTSSVPVKAAGLGDDSVIAVHSDQHIAASGPLQTRQKLHVNPLPIAAVSSIAQCHHLQQAQLVSSHSAVSPPDSTSHDTCTPDAVLYHQKAPVQAQPDALGTSESAKSQRLLLESSDVVRREVNPGKKRGWVSRSKRFIQHLCQRREAQ